jgi:hypothetical protein
MVWTRAVLIMSVLGIVVVAVSAQSNLASSSPTETARANQTQETGTAAKGADSKAEVTMSAAIHVSLVMRIKADASTRPR